MTLAIPALLFGLSVSTAPSDMLIPAELPISAVARLLPQQPLPQDQQQNAPQTPDKKPDDPQATPPDRAEEKKPATPPHTGIHALLGGLKEDVQHLPSRPNLYLTLLGGGLALAAHPADATFNQRLISHYDTINTAFKAGKIIGQTPLQMGLALATYAYGRASDSPKVSHFGMDLLRAQIVAEVLTEALKLATHRERPNHENHQSFPSGHASITFASATVIERHLGWKYSVLGYTIASYVAASRLHDNRHYLSDVVFGAAVGAIAGRTVTQHGRETWTFAPATVPGGGIAVFATRTSRGRS